MPTRRDLITAGLAATLAAAAGTVAPAPKSVRDHRGLASIRKRIGGRLGVHVLDSQSGKRIGLDDQARFAMASTFKLPLAAALLWQVDHQAFDLERTLAISPSDVIHNSPSVQAKLAQGATSMTIRELCQAVITASDNGAANVLLAGIGGPAALTAFFRSFGDEVTRFDRIEPELNSNLPADPRDTTTPAAMVDSLLKIFTQNVLSLPSRALLIEWMGASHTGMKRVRAGLPPGWQAGDKSGTGANGAVNDLLVAFPPGRRPILAAVYMSESKLSTDELSAAHAEIGAIIASEFKTA